MKNSEQVIETEWAFKEGIEVLSDEFWYDLTDGGYIKPAEVLIDQDQAKKLQEAIDLVRSFEHAIYEKWGE